MDPEQLKKVSQSIKIGIGVLIVLLLGFNSFYTVNEQQKAVIMQFGKAISTSDAGLHFKIPLIQSVRNVKMTTNGMEFGYRTVEETNESVESESFMITKDFNFVTVDFYVEWRVSDPTKYLFNSADPEGLLRNILQAEARSVVSSYNVDDVLTTAKSEIQAKVKESVLYKLDEYDLGIVVSNLTIQDTEPPTQEVIAAFKNVENAKQHKDTEINLANTYNNEVIPKARAEADKIIKEAEADKEARINEAKGQVARFNEMFKQYILNKDITKSRIYLETMEQILPDVKVFVDGGSDTLKVLNIDGQNTSRDNRQNDAAIAGGLQGGENIVD